MTDVNDLIIKAKGSNEGGFDIEFLNIPEIEGYPFNIIGLIKSWVDANQDSICRETDKYNVDAVLKLVSPRLVTSISYTGVGTTGFLFNSKRYAIFNNFECYSYMVYSEKENKFKDAKCSCFNYTDCNTVYIEKTIRWKRLRDVINYIGMFFNNHKLGRLFRQDVR